MTAMHDASLPTSPRHGRLVGRLVLLAGGCFIFGFALVPLYDTLCKAVGFNGKTLKDALSAQEAGATAVDSSRSLNVQFTATVMPGLPWDIRPLEPAFDLHPGELRTTRFLVRNLSDQPIVGQAVPSVSPTVAASHFRKLDCFCFKQQTLAPGESREMALTFIVDRDIGPDLRELTLAYAFFPAPTPR
ncbi:MAG TPA: cytochrome c oxidase assembly protein [Zoogloea sp.]|uniref:cytochrome c oxidase assembly protein n=1 Tax=Zoogloea sp. TaxID=49181 RepID=UPI002BA7A3D8|nr:cytochrome c oxidase assembly protein [Zoogloea sp.]HMV17206.1 cytochrome c oxidase assembly protein [Rhodocyclaceae bacterium]HMV63137.1 cytochrome c oxidase assembly protein [Rhodocyclaceae bacterium]HMW51423.1 cytochrome c oxidase assembly protein [Rhodocyclaceae bacterium]HMY48568.1 cytochrome c oxidase assembly protein [Rhodocyclaceae bacterium]HMZ74897.1 cytochrome c oxidase assembly protein [Rhodocyclaceae bacterium]